MIELSKRIAVALSLLCLFASASQAAPFTIPVSRLIPSSDYYTDIIGGGIGSPLLMTGGDTTFEVGVAPNDDGFAEIDLGFVFNLFGTDYTKLWANNNGIVSFGGGFATWTDGGVSATTVPVIAPFFADVDTTGTENGVTSGVMHLRTDIPNQIIITWAGVGYYRGHTDKLNSFQLVLRGTDFAAPAEEGQVGFFYKAMGWETGDFSGGDAGFGGTPAAIGFGDGIGLTEVVLEFSLQDGISGIVADHHIWINRDLSAGLFGAPLEETPPVPEPATLLLVGTGAAFLGRKLYSRTRQG